GERGDAHAVLALLLGKARSIGGTRLEPADVVAFHLGQGERADRRPLRRKELAVRTAAGIGVEKAVVADDQYAVLGHAEIELERGDTDLERGRERLERVLRRQPARATMSLQVEGEGRSSGE